MVERIWNFLGGGHVPRAEDKTVMKLKHWQEVNNGKMHKSVQFPVAAQVKKDGVYALILVLPTRALIFNRTGRLMQNVQGLEQEIHSALWPCGVYMAELCNAFCSLEVLSGIVNPNRTKELDVDQAELACNNHLFLHDYIAMREFISGESTLPYTKRHAVMSLNLSVTPQIRATILPYTLCHNEADVEHYAHAMIAGGQEGAVFKPETIWEAGHKGWRMMKWVREINYDLLCVGIEEGKGKYTGKVANLLLKWQDGKTIKAMLGKGWTHADAERLFIAHGYADLDDNPVGKVYRVRGLSDSSKGVIRLPKVMEERHDKVAGDF